MYCKKCGTEIADDAEYCPSCGAGINVSELVLAGFGERFLAYILDAMIIGFIVGAVAWPWGWAGCHMPFVDLGLNHIPIPLLDVHGRHDGSEHR